MDRDTVVHAQVLTPEQLEAIRRFDTCTIANAIGAQTSIVRVETPLGLIRHTLASSSSREMARSVFSGKGPRLTPILMKRGLMPSTPSRNSSAQRLANCAGVSVFVYGGR